MRVKAYKYVNSTAEAEKAEEEEEEERNVEYIDPTTSHGTVSYFRVHKAWPRQADRHAVTRAVQRVMGGLLAGGEGDGRYEAMVSAFSV